MMDAAPTNTDAAAPRRGGLAAAPLLALCCLLFILFAIAATIVLALIPIYLPRKEATLGAVGTPLYLALTTEQDIGEDGPLDAASSKSLADGISQSRGYPVGSIAIDSAEIASNAGRRRRRKRNLKRIARQGGGLQKLIRCIARNLVRFLCPICAALPALFNIAVQVILRGIIIFLIALVRVLGSAAELASQTPAPATTTTTASTTTASTASTASTTPSMDG